MSAAVWELVICTGKDCGHQHARHVEGKRALPCHRCEAEMVVVPIVVSSVEQTAAGFGPAAMREALRWAFRAEAEKANGHEDEGERARHLGRAEAFSEALDMLAAVTRRGSGVVSDRVARGLFASTAAIEGDGFSFSEASA